ncbi:hypothetical protein TNCV_4296941 [Trichonephila clavipes]|nr:hypothetical protein TNCV_4296941 [Trichonephila clavipes]
MPNSVYVTLGPEMHEQMFPSGGQSDSKTPSVKFPSKLDTHFVDTLKGKAESTLPNPVMSCVLTETRGVSSFGKNTEVDIGIIIVVKDHYGQGGLMDREGIREDKHTDLHLFDRGTLTSQRYRDEILEPTSISYFSAKNID